MLAFACTDGPAGEVPTKTRYRVAAMSQAVACAEAVPPTVAAISPSTSR